MRFSTNRQPRYAVYIVRDGTAVLVARYVNVASALTSLARQLELGEIAYHDVN